MKNAALLPVIASALAIFSSSAYADNSNTPAGSSVPVSFDAFHSGLVTSACSLTIKDGQLSADPELVSGLVTPNNSQAGEISTVCNTVGSTLMVQLSSGTDPTESFELSLGTGAYPATSTGFVTTPVTRTDLSNGFSTTPSTLRVRARAAAPRYPQDLGSGAVIVRVQATITP